MDYRCVQWGISEVGEGGHAGQASSGYLALGVLPNQKVGAHIRLFTRSSPMRTNLHIILWLIACAHDEQAHLLAERDLR